MWNDGGANAGGGANVAYAGGGLLVLLNFIFSSFILSSSLFKPSSIFIIIK